MALFRTDSIVVVCSSVEEAKRWWIEKFGCKQVKLPNWDNPLPSDVALKLPGDAEATVLLSDRAEVASAGLNRSGPVPIIFSEKVKKAHEYLAGKGVAVGPLQNDGNSDFFEIRDPEGNVIEICQES